MIFNWVMNAVLEIFIPPANIREIRDLLRYRSKLVSFISSEKNRVQNSLTVSNIMLSNVVSDTFGKSASAILSHLLKYPPEQDFDFRPLLHGSMLKKQDDIALAIDGTISEVQACKITLYLSHMDAIKSYITQIEELLCDWLYLIPVLYRLSSLFPVLVSFRHL